MIVVWWVISAISGCCSAHWCNRSTNGKRVVVKATWMGCGEAGGVLVTKGLHAEIKIDDISAISKNRVDFGMFIDHGSQ
jgi:hypothetical protein